MKVICASKPDKFKNLTLNKEYENVIEDGEAYVVPNDSGFRSRYAKKYFRVVPETPAEPPRPATRNLLDILELEYFADTETISITLNRTTRDVNITIVSSPISCGITEIDNIGAIKTAVNDIFDHKVATIVGDRNSFFRRVMEYLIAEIRRHESSAFILMSDNESVAHSEDFHSILSELSVGNFSRNNPNSNNNITLWVINGTE